MYVSRYVNKKICSDSEYKKKMKERNYQMEFILASRRPGIGSSVIDRLADNLDYKINNQTIALNTYYATKLKERLSESDLARYTFRADLNSKTKINNLIAHCGKAGYSLEDYRTFANNLARQQLEEKKQKL